MMTDTTAIDAPMGETSLDIPALSQAEFETSIFPAEQRRTHGLTRHVIRVACAALTIFTLFFAFRTTIGEIASRGLYLAFAVPLSFLLYPALHRSRKDGPSMLDWGLAALAVIAFGWAVISQERWLDRYVGFDPIPNYDIALGVIALIVTFEATRRTVGGVIVGLNLVFIVYAVTGPYWPGLFQHRGIKLDELIETLYMDTSGLFNFITGIMATFLFAFLLFGVLLRATGGDVIFTNLALSVAGHRRGGPAKVAVISSGLMGMLSGSSISNVATTGVMTIPLMKRTGYKPVEAAAIEVVASVGGALAPPLMGAGAFIMANLTGLPLTTILLYSVAPAILYYLALYVFTDTIAAKRDLKGLPREQLPTLVSVFVSGWHILGSILILIGLMLLGYTPYFAAAACVIGTFFVAMMRRSTRLDFRKTIALLEAGARTALSISALLASAALIYGVVVQTGLLTKVTSILLTFSGGSAVFAIILLGLISYFVGMGLPVTASYVIIAALGAPFLQDLGVSLLAAHLIIFWFAQDSTITPPICMTAMVGARIAGAPPMQTGWLSVKIAKALYLLPFVFAFGGLLDDRIHVVVLTAVAVGVCLCAMQIALIGYWRRPLSLLERGGFSLVSVTSFLASIADTPSEAAICVGITAAVAAVLVVSSKRAIKL
ncbi:TRAP transporter permease [Nitratireductor indicus]|nr:TRAP transporter fused permease subunit [Nitratireductor indicus]